MPVPETILLSGRIFEHVAMSWSALVLTCGFAMAAVVYAWFAVGLWMVEDGIPGKKLWITLIGALVATAFALLTAVNYLRMPGKKCSLAIPNAGLPHANVKPTDTDQDASLLNQSKTCKRGCDEKVVLFPGSNSGHVVFLFHAG